MLARETMCGLVALPAQGLQIREAVRFRAFGMVHVEVFVAPHRTQRKWSRILARSFRSAISRGS
jgi:hypothetical protein